MSWAEIGKAVNSTVGTKDFKPLNEIIRGNWNLIESERIYISETPAYTSSSGTYTISNSFKFKANGSARIRLVLAYSTNTTYTLETYKNGNLYRNIARAGNGASNNISIIESVTFKPEDLFTFRLVRTGGSTAVSSMTEIAVLCEAVYAPVLVESL